jgi:hypothetical protein
MEAGKGKVDLFLLLFSSIFGGVLLFSSAAYADGKFFPQVNRVAPAIPSQRAILSYKDGDETLIIESALDGEGVEFGWIVPVPAKPSKFKKVSPGLIKTLDLAVQPRLIHNLNYMLRVAFGLSAVVTLLCLMSITKRPRSLIYRILLYILALIILFFSGIVTMGGMAEGVAATSEKLKVKIHELLNIGSYELAVLEAEKAEDLNKWLINNNFTGLSKKDEAIISDYIRDKWYFVAAKLRREGDGYSVPHPVSMTFGTPKPVYPVKLTGTLDNQVYLTLFVIADRKAECEQLTLELSDRYSKEYKVDYDSKIKNAYYNGETFRQDIGHPEAENYFWDSCIVNRFTSILDPSQMQEDLFFQLKKPEHYQKRYHSYQGARSQALKVSLLVWCILLMVVAVICGRAKNTERAKRNASVQILLLGPVILLLSWGITYLSLPKVEVEVSTSARYAGMRNAFKTLEIEMLCRAYYYFRGNDANEISQIVSGYFASSGSMNFFTNERIIQEVSPGNYTVVQEDEKVVCRLLSKDGSPEDIVLTSEPKEDDWAGELASVERKLDDPNKLYEHIFVGEHHLGSYERPGLEDPFLTSEPEEDYRAEELTSIRKLMENPKKLLKQVCVDKGYHWSNSEGFGILVMLYKSQPKEVATLVLDDLKKRVGRKRDDADLIKYELAMLGCISHTTPPLEIKDKTKVNSYIETVENWCNEQM